MTEPLASIREKLCVLLQVAVIVRQHIHIFLVADIILVIHILVIVQPAME